MLEALRIDAVTPFEGWRYEWVTATAAFAVAATDEPAIVDLDRAPADPDGLIRFESDVRLLRPAAGRNGRVLQVVPNRGMVGGVPFSTDVSREMAKPGAPP